MTPGELQLETPDYWKSYRTKNTVLLQQINWKRREKPWINRLTYQTIHCVDFFVSQFKQINCNEKTSMKQLGKSDLKSLSSRDISIPMLIAVLFKYASIFSYFLNM